MRDCEGLERCAMALFKQENWETRCSRTGELVTGKRVLKPLRFFVSDALQNYIQPALCSY